MDIESPKGVTLRGFDSPEVVRQGILDRVLLAYQDKFPVSNDKVVISAKGIKYGFDPKKPYTVVDEKNAIIRGDKLSVPITGDLTLKDANTGETLDEFSGVIARVPWMTHRGSFINGGGEYSLVAGQQRLKPGVYARRKANGELESHINVTAGTGAGMRVFMEPSTGVFRVMIGKSMTRLYPVLKGMGIDDQDIAKYWGSEVLDINKKDDGGKSFTNFYQKLMKKKSKTGLDLKQMSRDVLEEMGKSEIDPEVAGRTLGSEESRLSPFILLRSSNKLLNIHKGLEDEDDRDSMANKNFLGPEDLFEERVRKDAGQMFRGLLGRSAFTRSLRGMKPGYFTPQLDGLIVGNSLSNHISGINPIQFDDYQRRVVQTGEGAITTMDAIPLSSRNVSPSQAMVVDPIRSSESKNIGVDQRFAIAARKGSDGNIYFPVRNRKTGKVEYINAIKMGQSIVAFPQERSLMGEGKMASEKKVDSVVDFLKFRR